MPAKNRLGDNWTNSESIILLPISVDSSSTTTCILYGWSRPYVDQLDNFGQILLSNQKFDCSQEIAPSYFPELYMTEQYSVKTTDG